MPSAERTIDIPGNAGEPKRWQTPSLQGIIEGRGPTLNAGRTMAVPGNEGGKTTTTPLPRLGLDPSKPDYTMYLEIFNYKP
jgi:hypothetical protein